VEGAQQFIPETRPAYVPLWLEGLWGADWLALKLSPVFLGFGVPRGDGSAVIPIPGFLGTDLYLLEMREWFRRIGYRPYSSKIGYNADCLDLITKRILKTIDRAASDTGRPVHLVGHSLGGVLSRAAANLRPESVASVVTMASPFRGISSHPFVLRMGDFVRDRIRRRPPESARPPACYTGHCGCDAVSALRRPLPSDLPQRAIYTKTDGVVNWRFCVNHDRSTNIQVPGTHVGLAFNPLVYGHIARFLASVRDPN
jgi:pimeloyl-ACP methyl ester carboxylesterase